MENTFKVKSKKAPSGEYTFQVRELRAYPEQILLVQVASPLALDFLPIMLQVVGDPETRAAARQNKVSPQVMIDFIVAGLTGVQKLTSENLLLLCQRAFAAVQLQQGPGWADIVNPSGALMFEFDLKTIMQLLLKVAEVNLLDFFFESLGTSQGEEPQENQ